MNRLEGPFALRYGAALVVLVAAVLLRWLLDPILGDTLALVTLYAAVAAAVWVGGYRPALLNTVLGYAVCAYLFIEPRGEFGLSEARNVVDLCAYLLTCLAIVGLGERMRRAERRQRDGEHAALQQAALWRTTLAGIADGVIATDTGGRVISMNAVAESLTGWTVGKALGQPLDAVFTGSFGEARSIEHSVAPICTERDDHVGSVLVFRDISDRKEAEDAMRRAEGQLRTIIDNVPALISFADVGGRYRLNNQAYERWFGRSRGEITGRHMRDVLGAAAWEVVGPKVGAALAGQTVHYEAQVPYKDAGLRWIDATYVPNRGAAGEITGVVVLVNDITARKEAEDKARKSEAWLELLLRSIKDHLVTYDREWCYVYVNDRAAEILGRPRDQLIGQCIWDLFPDAVGNQYYTELHRALAEQQAISFEHFYAPFDAWFENHIYPSPDGVTVFAADITARKRAEEQLRQANERFELAARATRDGIWDFDPATGDNMWSPRCFELLGMPAPSEPQPVTQAWINERMHPDDYAPMWAAAEAYWAGRVPQYVTEMRLRHEDGSYRWFLSRGVAIQDEAGQVVRMTGALSDDHDRRVAEQALRKSEERFRTAVLATSEIVWTNDADGSMAGVQPGWGAFTGQTEEEYQGHGWSAALHPDDAQPTVDAWVQTVAERRRFDFEHRVRRRDGAYRLCSVRAVPILDAGGSVSEWVGVHTDVTEQRALEQQLKDADRRKDEFLATLAHELRNPLAPIRNGLQIMRLAGVDGTAVEQARTIMERQLEQMVRLVDDLMDVSRITRGKLDLRLEHATLADVLSTAMETSRPVIESSGNAFSVSVPSEPIFMRADVTRLAQVFANLLNNAARYSRPGGRISLGAERQGGDVVVCVKDTGVGIPPEMLPKIFDMFTQVDESLDRSQGGLGIGLTLVKSLVEMHGGTVEARSEGYGQGAEFIVRLPVVLSVVEQRTLPTDTSVPAHFTDSRRILVADDNLDSATSLAMMLTIMGHDVRTANDGVEAMDVAIAFQPDVILLDIGMPKMNGYDTCRGIRGLPWGDKPIVIALTGWGQEDDRRRSEEAGFNHHLVKPVDPAALARLWVASEGGEQVNQEGV